MRVAIIHYWLINMRGGEAVVEALLKLFPDADIYTHVHDPSLVSDFINTHEIRTTFIQKLPFASTMYKKYLPLMPLALEELDVTRYDLIISSESGPAKGIVPGPNGLHVCYTHSPMRYVWDQYYHYKKSSGLLNRLMMPTLSHSLRQWDVSTASRVDHFIANSSHVSARIRKYYRRDSAVIYPPVATDAFAPVEEFTGEPFYLWAGELASYKRPDLLVAAFKASGRKLVVAGAGDCLDQLRKESCSNITFLGKVDFPILKELMATCRALVFPGEEDFGIVPVEVMASGRPVIAYGKGGALDSVVDGQTGLLFAEQTIECINDAIERFESCPDDQFDSASLVRHAKGFSEATFLDRFRHQLLDYGVEESAMVGSGRQGTLRLEFDHDRRRQIA
ncbi:glycosyltransferase [Granulosicoccus sp. 3-233]|uniref:glycosyltransferase n=1 Tax=Granulosicoccus sp. 3-233 TaxID=3417969 RepID=UPI003D33FD89